MGNVRLRSQTIKTVVNGREILLPPNLWSLSSRQALRDLHSVFIVTNLISKRMNFLKTHTVTLCHAQNLFMIDK